MADLKVLEFKQKEDDTLVSAVQALELALEAAKRGEINQVVIIGNLVAPDEDSLTVHGWNSTMDFDTKFSTIHRFAGHIQLRCLGIIP